jgi:hypothetical protein
MEALSTRITSQLENMSDDQRSSFMTVAKGIEQLNQSIRSAVDNGLSIELQRVGRHHDGGGFWGDIMMPHIVKQG